MKKVLKILIATIIAIVLILVALYAYLPINRVNISSELIMLGDLNGHNKWDIADANILKTVISDPFSQDTMTQIKVDLNKNGAIDKEDIVFSEYLYRTSDPYEAEKQAKENKSQYPRPRELFFYLPKDEYIQAPLFLLDHKVLQDSPFIFLNTIKRNGNSDTYEQKLLNEIYSEAIRFSISLAKRKEHLSVIEKDYVEKKISRCNALYTDGNYYDLLLDLISLVEDAETLTMENQTDFIKRILYFRDHLRILITSEDFALFTNGQKSYLDIYKSIEQFLKTDLDIKLELETLDSPRDFKNPKNYIDRAEWQAHKTKITKDDFKRLVLFAQHDRRYLRAVSNTSPKLQDIRLQNHNLPMILLFRKALEITQNDKKTAIGLLDEAVRIPLGWVKSIPKEMLPTSIALENFLLPGNMEDGLDKTRHWNVFGGVAIYKSPKDSLILSLKREIVDLKDGNHSPEAMSEFIRDTIANINGIYYVISIDPALLN